MKSIGKYLFEGLVILFSILGAFWLEEWGDDKERKERASQAISAIKSEILYNIQILETDKKNFRMFNQIMELSTRVNNNLTLSSEQLDSLKNVYSNNPQLLYALKPLDTINNQIEYYIPTAVFFFIPGEFSNATYKSIMGSELAVEIDFDTMKYINFCYQWIYKDFGVSSADFFRIMNGITPIVDMEPEKALDQLIDAYTIKANFLDSLSGPTFKLMDKYKE